jgi:DnaJ family protein C protein 13
MASTKNVETQHRLLGLLATVLGVSHDSIKDERYISSDIPENAEQLLNNESISQLCHFVAWGHTSPGQAGNLLSRLVGQTGKQLITDATSLGPGENRPVEDRPAANDLSCPAVWFVAPTGRNPPQPESIRGPFRVSALKEMITEGDLSPYHLATTSHVEEYDLDNPSETVTEAQIDTGKWKQINEIWQLRWQLCTDGSSSVIYTPVDVALLALKALVRLVDLHQSLDSRGIPFYPIPSAKRILCRTSREAMYASDRSSNSCETNPLPIICQAFLSSDSRIVELAAELLYKLCQHNDRAASKLYLSGVFYFVLCYTGNNFRTLAKLLHSVHLKQHFKSGFAAAADENEMPLKERSILGNVLPEGLLFILENYGADRFAEIFVGNADNPEVIWTFDMRKHLVEMIHQHLGDFPLRLHQNNTTEYEYCPMPGVAYKRLRKEMFCHNYYLENLCDENRFPDWPITEPLEVMRSCLEHFKSQVNHGKSSEEENLESARAVLCLNVGDGSKELRRAYRSMARKYHPDKNPSGREMFESIQKSYEILQLFLESGEKIPSISDSELKTESRYDQEIVFPTSNSQMQTMLHLVKTQIMICRRYEREMSRHSYPAYSVLFRCIELPKNIHEYTENNAILTSLFATSDRASFIQRVVELIFRTCLISPQNSEALVAEHGVPLLVCLLDFYVKVAQAYVASSPDPVAASTEKIVSVDTIAEIISHVVHTLSGVAFFPTGRDAIKSLPMLSEFLINWRRCLDESIFESKNDMALDSEMKRYALEGISYMAKDAKLQECLIGCGLVWPLLRYSLLYDSTLEQTIQDINSSDDVGFSVASINVAARHSIRALGVLSGLFGDDSPSNPALVVALDQLLTSPITRMLRNQRTGGILQVLNSTIERADILWNNQMRNQLEAFLRKIEKERPKSSCRTVEEELQPVTDFVYSVVGEEVIVGGIYIRFFNRGGKESLTYIDDPTRFFMSVTSYIAKSLNHAEHSFEWIKIPVEDEQSMDFCPSLKSQIFLHVLNALRILCRIDRLIDDVFCQTPNIAPSVLISLLELPLDSEVRIDIECLLHYSVVD